MNDLIEAAAREGHRTARLTVRARDWRYGQKTVPCIQLLENSNALERMSAEEIEVRAFQANRDGESAFSIVDVSRSGGAYRLKLEVLLSGGAPSKLRLSVKHVDADDWEVAEAGYPFHQQTAPQAHSESGAGQLLGLTMTDMLTGKATTVIARQEPCQRMGDDLQRITVLEGQSKLGELFDEDVDVATYNANRHGRPFFLIAERSHSEGAFYVRAYAMLEGGIPTKLRLDMKVTSAPDLQSVEAPFPFAPNTGPTRAAKTATHAAPHEQRLLELSCKDLTDGTFMTVALVVKTGNRAGQPSRVLSLVMFQDYESQTAANFYELDAGEAMRNAQNSAYVIGHQSWGTGHGYFRATLLIEQNTITSARLELRAGSEAQAKVATAPYPF